MSVPDFTKMDVEHKAWQAVVKEWKERFPGNDFNDSSNNALIKAIELWGERLAQLRWDMAPSHHGTIIAEKERMYEEAKRRGKS